MKILLYISCLLFSFIYSYFNYGISINATLSCILIIFLSFTILRKSKYNFQFKRIIFLKESKEKYIFQILSGE